MNVHVDTARQNQRARSVDDPPAARAAAQLDDLAVPDAKVALT
jgi:hypothetical protein